VESKNGITGSVIKLRTGAKGRLKPGHPWIYADQLLKFDRPVKPAEVVTVLTADGKFVGRGYYNPKSLITVRLLTFKDEAIDRDFFGRRLKECLEKRKDLFDITDAYRAVFSESDGLPGLILDMYADTAVFQIFTLGMEKFRDDIIESVREVIGPKYIYERGDSPYRKIEGLEETTGWVGPSGNDVVEIREYKTRFFVDVAKGHKTGFYLDQRRARMGLENISKNKKVLDLFCFSGGFAVSAAVYGAQSVLAVDIKEDWLELGRRNAELNGVSNKIKFMKGDVFDVLREKLHAGEKYDIVVLDPPSFLRTKKALAGAARGYKELNLTAMKVLADGGVLCTFSCSHNMPNEMYSDIIKKAALDAGKDITVLKRCHQAMDHPIARQIPETEYLKGYFLKVTSKK
jgi:23S rRNA (cytosine1962-C5)-methyltransferase